LGVTYKVTITYVGLNQQQRNNVVETGTGDLIADLQKTLELSSNIEVLQEPVVTELPTDDDDNDEEGILGFSWLEATLAISILVGICLVLCVLCRVLVQSILNKKQRTRTIGVSMDNL